ncbi:MAG: HAMP domain-containing histidine kinase [Heliobacteriaceae bacterium]|jgi:signal transduction histidine kinase|nr:HAMP domain-containing histidine kinase [Heliobacteriaceae bacterium]
MDNYEDFISTVSHELRTPLTSIRGFSQTMLNSWDKLDDESKQKFLKIIEEQSNRLIGLVENMLSVTKLQCTNLILKEVSVKPVVNTIVSLIKNSYQNHQFFVEINENINKILADRDKFQQVLMNLVENAAKYSAENSHIIISAENCGDFVSIKVVSTGVGIDEADYERIFEKFSRVDNPLTRKVEGSGLGLFITKNLVEKMDGKIAVESENGVTTFEVLMPVSNIEQQARSKCAQ